ncbi:hypothetical protein AB4345_05330 [Vibrio breoganii]
MCSETYNGYSNYPTWACMLWLTNEPHTHQYLTDIARKHDSHRAAELIRQFVEHDVPELPTSLYSDLLNVAVDSIDFYEIVEALQT